MNQTEQKLILTILLYKAYSGTGDGKSSSKRRNGAEFQERAGETENHLQNEGNVAIAEETRDA